MTEVPESTRHSVSGAATPRLTAERPVIVNGSSVAGGLAAVRQVLALPRKPEDSAAAQQARKAHHKPSKSGPIPVSHMPVDQVVGIEKVGPSRLPNRPLDVPTLANGSAQDQVGMASQVAGNQGNFEHRALPPAGAYSTDISSRRPSTSSSCKNPDIFLGGGRWRAQPCECTRCKMASRSVFIRILAERSPRINTAQRQNAITAVFSRWGHVEECAIKTSSTRARPFAFIRYASEESAIRAVAEGDGEHIPLMNTRVKVTHPWASKYYVPEMRNPSPPRWNGTPSHRHYSPGSSTRSGATPPNGHGNALQWPATPVQNYGQTYQASQRSSSGSSHASKTLVPFTPVNSWDPQNLPAPFIPGTTRSASTVQSGQALQHARHPEGHPFFPPHYGPGFWVGPYPPYDGPFHQQFHPAPQGPPPQPYFGPHPPHGWAGMPYPPGVVHWQVPQPHAPPMIAQGWHAPPQPRGNRRPSNASSRMGQTPTGRGHRHSDNAAASQALLEQITSTPANHAQATIPEDVLAQSKPPSEEALSGDEQQPGGISNSNSASSLTESIRVRLPSTDSKKAEPVVPAKQENKAETEPSPKVNGVTKPAVPEKQEHKAELPPCPKVNGIIEPAKKTNEGKKDKSSEQSTIPAKTVTPEQAAIPAKAAVLEQPMPKPANPKPNEWTVVSRSRGKKVTRGAASSLA